MSKAEELINEKLGGTTQLDEKSITLAPESDALNALSNTELLLRTALEQIKSAEKMMRTMSNVPGIKAVNSHMRLLMRDVNDAHKTANSLVSDLNTFAYGED